MRKTNFRIVSRIGVLICLVIGLSIIFSIQRIKAQKQLIPIINSNVGKYQLAIPDWAKISWANLPVLQEAGQLSVPSEFIKQLGYDPSRIWNAGQKLESVVMLGDIEDAFKSSILSLKKISSIVSYPSNLSLKDFGIVKWQTLESLLKAIPSLGSLNVSQVKPIQDFLSLSGVSGGTISEVVGTNLNGIAQLPLEKLDLSKYSLNSIPGLEQTEIGSFKDWQRSFINQVPGLSQLPLSQMPQPLSLTKIQVGVASTVFGKAERGSSKVDASYYISGSVNSKDATVAIACEEGKECAYLELGDLAGSKGAMYGKRWASGLSQKVKGGFGLLGSVNGGKEPTGRLVFGSAFKVVLTGTNESKGTADFGLYFRACVHLPFGGRTCTPYFIGPVPWLPVHENDLVIVGV